MESLYCAGFLPNSPRWLGTPILRSPLVAMRRAPLNKARRKDLRGMIVQAVAGTFARTILVTRVCQAFASTPSLSRLYGSVTVAKGTPHVPAIGIA